MDKLGNSLSTLFCAFKTRWFSHLKIGANMGRKCSGKACPHCPAGRQEGVEESSQHWLECQAYLELRRGLDPEGLLEDRALHLRSVQTLRTKLLL